MKTLLVLGIAVISIIGLLLMTALASRTLIPVQKYMLGKGWKKVTHLISIPNHAPPETAIRTQVCPPRS